MIIQLKNMTLLHIYTCGNCKKVYRKSLENVMCLVNHSPGSCCHFGETEIPNEALQVILASYNVIMGKYRREKPAG